MELHTGAIVERVVRRSGVSITELARRTNVNRRSVYNWFNQKILKLDVICKIGNVLGHDFSLEFPNYFPNSENNPSVKKSINVAIDEANSSESVYYWMNKYIGLLEKYNELLVKASKREFKHPKANLTVTEENETLISSNYKVLTSI